MSLFCHFLWVQKTFDLQILVLLKSGKRMEVQRVNRKKSKNTKNAANRPDPTGTEIKRVEHRRDTRRLTHNQRHTQNSHEHTKQNIEPQALVDSRLCLTGWGNALVLEQSV